MNLINKPVPSTTMNNNNAVIKIIIVAIDGFALRLRDIAEH